MSNTDNTASECTKCGSWEVERVITTFGGYSGDTGSGSTRPKGAGSFKKKRRSSV